MSQFFDALKAGAKAAVGAWALFGYALGCDGCSYVMLFGDAPERP